MRDLKTVSCKNFRHTERVLFIYWAILVAWQYANGYTSKGLFDIAVKTCLLIALIIYFFRASHGKLGVNKDVLKIVMFIFCLIPPLVMEPSLSLETIIFYLFIILNVTLFLVVGGRFKVTEKDYVWFLNAVIYTAVIIALYAMVFQREQFASSFKYLSAYGNELSSFLSSSHEFGMYMSAAVISCVFQIEIKKSSESSRIYPYIFFLVILVPNLALSFSRTAIFSTVIFIFAYVFLGKSRKLKLAIMLLIISTFVLIVTSDTMGMFLQTRILKNGALGDRDLLYDYALNLFKDSSSLRQLFGNGIIRAQSYLRQLSTHRSVHNAYLQVLVYFGLSGLTWLLGFLVNKLICDIKLRKQHILWSSKFICLDLWCIAMMMANTHLIFTSPVDCYFLTIFSIVIPRYVNNWIKSSNTIEVVLYEEP